MLEKLNLYTANLVLITLSVNVLLGALSIRRLNPVFLRLFYFLCFNWVIEILALIFIELDINNLPLLHLYTVGEFVLISYFFKLLIRKPRFFQSQFWVIVTIGSTLIILNSIFYQSIFDFNSLAKTSVQIVIISYTILYFYNLVENQTFSLEVAKSLRLINSAIMVYYSGSLFIFMCSQISIANPDAYKLFWIFNSSLNFFLQLIILREIWKVFFKKIPLSL